MIFPVISFIDYLFIYFILLDKYLFVCLFICAHFNFYIR